MRIRQLEAFRATVISGTVSAAAISTRTSQPTVSRLLKQLEHELGIALFRRESGRIHLTNEGLRFYERVDDVYSSINELGAFAKTLRADALREVRILTIFALSMTVVPEIVARLVERHPDIRVNLITLDKYSYFRGHCETEHDVLLGPRIGFESQVHQIPVAMVDFVCILPEGHRLTGKRVVGAEDLAGERMISQRDDTHRVFIKHEEVFRNAGVAVEQKLFCDSSASIYEMVRRGLGVALVEPFSAPIWDGRGVVIRPFEPHLRYEFIAGLKPGILQSESARLILEITREVFSRYDAAPLE